MLIGTSFLSYIDLLKPLGAVMREAHVRIRELSAAAEGPSSSQEVQEAASPPTGTIL